MCKADMAAFRVALATNMSLVCTRLAAGASCNGTAVYSNSTDRCPGGPLGLVSGAGRFVTHF